MIIDHGIQADIAGTTVTSRKAWTANVPPLATISAVTFWGAAAGVAVTFREAVKFSNGWRVVHSGVIDVIKPVEGNPSILKQTLENVVF
jgi:hypothetical protein